jgi:LPS-assembly protein
LGAEADCGAAPAQTVAVGEVKFGFGHLTGAVNSQSLTLEDCVVLHYQDSTIHADSAVIDRESLSTRIPGPLSYEDKGIRVEANSGSYDPASGARFDGASFELLQQPGRGQGESLTRTPAGIIDLTRFKYTTCKDCPAAWQISAERISLNPARQRGLARGARIELNNVPVVYVPVISFPLSDARQTGLLFPAFGSSSRNGATLAVPWYWNIAPNRDLTLTPTVYARRGINLGAEFRQLQQHSAATVLLDYLPADRLTGDQRSHQQLDAVWHTSAGWRLRINGENVSDTRYLEDFPQVTTGASTAFLPRQIEVSWRSDRLQLVGSALHYQTLDTALPEAQRPYTVLPRLELQWRRGSGDGLRTTLDAGLAGFERRDSRGGWRAEIEPAIAWQFKRPGYYLRPALAWNTTAYNLRATTGGANQHPTRSVPLLSVDTGLQLERMTGGGKRRLTLEPRLLYVYIPFRDQSQLPVFDTGLPDPNFISLYRVNRYVGADRIGDANRLAADITARLVDGRTGRQYLSATLSQNVNFVTPKVTLPGEVPTTRHQSDYVASVDLRTLRDWNLRFDLAWDPDQARAQKSQVALQYQRSNKQVVNLGYRFDRNAVEQADASAAWPVGRRWEAYGRMVYSLRDAKAIDSFAGLHFRGDCWGIRAVVHRALSNRNGRLDTGIYLQFELTGLSSVGTGADTFLQQSIQGYSAVDPR